PRAEDHDREPERPRRWKKQRTEPSTRRRGVRRQRRGLRFLVRARVARLLRVGRDRIPHTLDAAPPRVDRERQRGERDADGDARKREMELESLHGETARDQHIIASRTRIRNESAFRARLSRRLDRDRMAVDRFATVPRADDEEPAREHERKKRRPIERGAYARRRSDPKHDDEDRKRDRDAVEPDVALHGRPLLRSPRARSRDLVPGLMERDRSARDLLAKRVK